VGGKIARLACWLPGARGGGMEQTDSTNHQGGSPVGFIRGES